MATKKRTRADDATPADRYPRYDPAVHAGDDLVFFEAYCRCGGLRRIKGPAGKVGPFVADWWRAHPPSLLDGDGRRVHEPASKSDCVAARERRRHAAHVAAGREHEYQPKTYERIDTADTTVIAWPPQPAIEAEEV